MSNEDGLELWIGKVEFRPLHGSVILGGSKGALSNVVTWARNPEEFREKAARLAELYLLFIKQIEDEEPIRLRREKHTLTESVEEQIAAAELNPAAILFGTLHKYKYDPA